MHVATTSSSKYFQESLAHLDKEEAKAKAERKRVKKMPEKYISQILQFFPPIHIPDSTYHRAWRKQPWHCGAKHEDDSKKEKNSHALVATQGAVAHLQEDIDKHPEAEADAKESDADDDESPGSPDE